TLALKISPFIVSYALFCGASFVLYKRAFSIGQGSVEFDIVKTEMSVIFTILLSIHAFASTGYHGPVSSALGGSGRSAIIPGETTLNPAALSFVQGWHATISYRDFTLDPSGKITN